MTTRPSESLAQVLERTRLAFEAAQRDPTIYARQAEAERAEYQALLRSRCDLRGVPAGVDVRRWVFANEPRGEACEVLTSSTAQRGEPGRGRWALVVLLGGTGVGKTSALARFVARHPREALYDYAADAAQVLVDRAHRGPSERYELLREVDLLTLDELGTEAPNDTPELLRLIARRCDAGKMTALAGNLSLEQFTARYLETDARFASRLGSPQGRLVHLDGADLRADEASS
jgi:hypothetical protein